MEKISSWLGVTVLTSNMSSASWMAIEIRGVGRFNNSSKYSSHLLCWFFLVSVLLCLSLLRVLMYSSSFLLASLPGHINLSSCVVWLVSLFPLLDR